MLCFILAVTSDSCPSIGAIKSNQGISFLVLQEILGIVKKTNQSGIVGVVGPLMGVAVDVVDVAPGRGGRAQSSGHDQNLWCLQDVGK